MNKPIFALRYSVTSVFLFASLACGAAYADGGANHQVRQDPLVEFGVQGGNANDLAYNNQGTPIGCYLGTLGCLLTDGNATYILSNNHVLARENSATFGEDILHTMAALCDPDAIHVADLVDYVPLVYLDNDGNISANEINTVDAAIAVVNGNVQSNGEIMDIGILDPMPEAPRLRLKVQKSGRTTGLTKSSIGAIGVNVVIGYDAGDAFFTNQILINGGNFSQPGDSGSLIVTNKKSCAQPVALLYAGGPSGTLANPISDVLAEFGGMDVVGQVCGDEPIDDGGGGGGGGGGRWGGPGGPPRGDIIGQAIAARNRNERSLMNLQGIVGTGIGVGDGSQDTAIEVYAEAVTPQLRRAVPRRIDGVNVRLIETGRFIAY